MATHTRNQSRRFAITTLLILLRCLVLQAIAFHCIVPGIQPAAWADQMPPAEGYIFGYTNQTSYAPGEEVALHLSSNLERIDFKVARLGPNTETVYELADVAVTGHPIPDRASSHGCNWPVAAKIVTDTKWKSGYYQITFTGQRDGKSIQSTAFFILRSASPGTTSRILIQLSTNTYNAYTNWAAIASTLIMIATACRATAFLFNAR